MKAESSNSLEKGIRFIGIGKHGSKDLPVSLVSELLIDLKSGDFNPIQQGAFFGALVTKGVAPHEYSLENYLGKEVLSNSERLFDRICEDAPEEMKPIGVKLLKGECLSTAEARQLGNFIFSDQSGEVLRGMAVSILRVRYESDEEYQGLLLAINDTFTAGFKQPVVAQAPIIQLAEPFDGVEHSYIITPILANALQKLGYVVVSTVGRSSGPKLSLNAWQLYQTLAGQFIKSNDELKSPPPALGWVLDQKYLSPALDRWVDRRRAVIKRPFLATLEKVLNPTSAKVLITSVFHLTYMEKMVELGMMAGFEGVIVLKRGLEGTLAPSIARASGILCAARQPNGTWTSTRIEADSSDFSQFRAETDAIVENLDVQENARLVTQFLENGSTANRDFDLRAGLAVDLYSRGLLWIEGVWQG